MNNIESQIANLMNDEEPYVGMPLRSVQEQCDPLFGLPLAMAYVPWQHWYGTYKPSVGFDRGTIFPELDFPFLGGGGDC